MSTADGRNVEGDWVVCELAIDGHVAREARLVQDGVEIGRVDCALDFPDDEAMADRHAYLRVIEEGLTKEGLTEKGAAGRSVELEDLGAGSGVWLRLTGSDGEAVHDGDQLWLGSQILVLRRREDLAAPVGAESGWEVRHHGPDGKLRATHEIPASGLLIGRASELALDPDDAQLSRRHLQLAFQEGVLHVFDRGAHNGSFRKLRGAESIGSGQEFRAASRRFRLERRAAPVGLGARLRSLGHANPKADPAPVSAPEPETESTPATSATPASEPSALPSEVPAVDTTKALEPPEIDASERTVVSLPVPEALSPEAQAPETEPERPAAAQDESRVLVVIDSDAGSVSLEVEPGRTVLEAVQAAGLERGQPVDWECGDGGCGVCIVGVVEGADRMDPPDPATGEMKTIQITEQVAPDPRQFRLACLAKVRGTVRLRKLT